MLGCMLGAMNEWNGSVDGASAGSGGVSSYCQRSNIVELDCKSSKMVSVCVDILSRSQKERLCELRG